MRFSGFNPENPPFAEYRNYFNCSRERFEVRHMDYLNPREQDRSQLEREAATPEPVCKPAARKRDWESRVERATRALRLLDCTRTVPDPEDGGGSSTLPRGWAPRPGYRMPHHSPLGQRRVVPPKVGRFGWIDIPWQHFPQPPEGLPIGTLCLIKAMVKDPMNPGKILTLTVEGDTSRTWTMSADLLFCGYQFRLAKEYGWFWDHDPRVLEILRDELLGIYEGANMTDPHYRGVIQSIVDRAETLRWRGCDIVRK